MSTPTVVVLHGAGLSNELQEVVAALRQHLGGLPIVLPAPPAAGLHAADAIRAQALSAALVLALISKELAADAEVTAALSAAAAAEIPLVPVLLAAYGWTSDPRLAALHGRLPLPRGGSPLAQAADLDQALVAIAAEVEQQVRSLRPALTPPSPARDADPLGLRALWIELTRVGPEQIAARCFNPYKGHYAPVTATLPRGRGADGVALFNLLFPDDGQRHQIFRDLAPGRDSQPAPTRFPVRLRIVTADKELAALPWSRTVFAGEALRHCGWTFALAPRSDRGGRSAAPYPLKVLLWTDQPHSALRHDVEALLRRHHGERLPAALYRHADDTNAASALRALRPGLVLVQGPTPKARLLELLREDPPRMLCCLGPAEADLPTALKLAEHVPLQLWPRPGSAADPERLLLRWLGAVLHGGMDPVDALYQEWPASGDPLRVFAHYDELELAKGPGPQELVAGPLALDRDDARALAIRHVGELVNHNTRRVEVLVAYGASDDLLEHLSDQAADAVKETLGVALQRQRLSFPHLPKGKDERRRHALELPQRLEQQLRVNAGARPETPLWTVLRGCLRGGRAAGPQVLWLDYGVFGGDHPGAQPALLPAELSAVAAFARDWLGRDCPGAVRVIVYLGRLVEPTRQEKFRASMAALENDDQLFTNRFRFTVLPGLGRVSQRHLRDYTSDSRKSRCDGSLAKEVAAQIYKKTGGEYAACVALLKEGEEEGYAALLQRLLGAPPPGAGPEDDEDDDGDF